MSATSAVRTRFAPSPTGYLHVGGARTALFNWLLARNQGGKLILRVEDTDRERNQEEAFEAIFSGLRWLGLDWDEGPEVGGDHGPYYQSERGEIYERWFEKLVETGRVYQDEGAWRFRFERRPVTMHDVVCGDVTIDYREESNTPDMVVRRSDGSFVFHFVNVVDDLEMGITHVVRGEDHLMNTPKHLQLIEALGAAPPIYAHVPLLLNPDGSKMSKRDAGAAVSEYVEGGFLPEAVVNFLVLLGWSPKDGHEIFGLENLIRKFELNGVNRAPAKFDLAKAKWVNQQHLQRMGLAELSTAARPYVLNAGLEPGDQFEKVVHSVREKVSLLSEFPQQVKFLLVKDFPMDEQALKKVRKNDQAHSLLGALAGHWTALDDWTEAKKAMVETAQSAGVKAGAMMFPVRVALSGKGGGPDLEDIMSLLGREESLRRIRAMMTRLDESEPPTS